MASKNVETIKRAHQCYNTRDLKQCVDQFADGGVYRDLPRGKDWPKAEFMDFLEGWAHGFSDSQTADEKYIDAGDTVVVEFNVHGTNDGRLGDIPATHKKIEMPYCEVVRFDQQGKIESVTAYYDLLGMMAQLGHLQAPREERPAAP
jgi:steroid delta-isomerase-like uncharacterized protein